MSYFTPYKEHYKALIRLGIPIVIGQIGIVVVGLADNMMVGQYATLDLAAASFVNSAFNIPILFGLGFSYGLTPLVGQFFGRHDKYHVGQLLRNSLLVNLFIGLLLTLAMTVVWFNIDRLGQPEELLPLIRPYFLLQLASLVFVMLFNSFKQFADGITDTKTPMYITISANLVNIAGNYILIYGKFGLPALGVVGAGISTLTALFSITGIMIGWLGSIALAAHQVVVAISTLGFMIYYGVGAAVSVRVSNYFGRQDLLHVRRTTMAGFHLILCLAVCACTVFLFSRELIGYLFTTSEEVIRVVSTLVYILLAYQFGDALQITYANSLRGIGDVISMAVISFIGYFLIAMPVCYICGFVLEWGITGIWIGYPIGLTLTGVMLCGRYYWKLKTKTQSKEFY